MRKQNSDFKTAFLSEVGTQLENHDYHGYVEHNDFACWVVADGLDESEHKKSAEFVVKGILELFSQKPGNSRHHLRNYLSAAHQILRRESTQIRLKSSVMIIVTDYMTLRYAHAGNVKLQIIANNQIILENEDHSYYQLKIKDGTYPADRLVGFEQRHNLTNYVGMPKGFKTAVSKKYQLKEMATILIMTVGFWEQLTNIEILDGLDDAKEPQAVINNLEDQLLSKQAKTLNNYTIATIFINKLFLKKPKFWPMLKRVLLIALPILLIVSLFVFMQFRRQQAQQELTTRVLQYELNGDDYVTHGSFVRALEQYNQAIALLAELRNFEDEATLRLKQRVNQLIVDGTASIEREDFERADDYFTRARDHLIDDGDEISIFSRSYIDGQLDYIASRLHINELLALGDLQVGFGQYGRALETYRTARTLALLLNNLALMQRLNISVDTAQALYDDAKMSLARLEAAEATRAAEGNEKLTPTELATIFEDVATIYAAAGLHEEAANMRLRADEIRTDEQLSSLDEQRRLGEELEASGDAALLAGDYQTALAYYQAAERIYRTLTSEFHISLITQKILAVNDLILAEQERANPQQSLSPPVIDHENHE